MPNKTLYVIPGYGSTGEGLEKVPLLIEARKKGYDVIPLRITWARRVPSQWISEAAKQIKTKNAAFLGFSFGAFIGVELAKSVKFSKLLLGSLSPYFADDAKYLPANWKRILGKRRIADATKHKFPTDIPTRAVFFVGEKDHPLVFKRAKKSFDAWHGPKKIEIIPNIGHEIGAPAYSNRVLKNL